MGGVAVFGDVLAPKCHCQCNELEPRAAAIFWVSFVVLLLAGGLVYFVRRNR